MIQLRAFRKAYLTRTILDIPDFQIDAGMYWIKGVNGAGKSTLFKAISGLIPFQGDVMIDEVSQKDAPTDYRRRVTYSEAEPLFPGFLSAKELVRFVGKSRNTTISRQDALCERLGITTYFDAPCATYSSGMLKKASLALAFLGEPSVIILDEPLVTLDDASRSALDQLVAEHRQKKTFLISSHETLTHGFSAVDGILEVADQQLRRV